MLKNYLTVAWRNLRRHQAFSLINIAGLAVGMACALLIFLYVQDELSFDQHHVNKDRIYRLITGRQGASFDGIAKVSGPWGVAARNALPEVEQMARFRFFGQTLVSRGDVRFYEANAFYTDPSVFDIFSFPLRLGNPETALAEPNAVVLTESIARRYFGEENPLGQTLTFDGQSDFTVTGVMDDVPANAHFTFPFLVSMASETDSLQYDWVRTQFYTYLLLGEEAAPEAVVDKFPAVLASHVGEEAAAPFAPRLQKITDIHLHSHLFREMQPNANVAYVYIFSAIALFILLIACINFMNLSTARSARRAREVGVRKASGARRGALIGQFLGESMLMSGIALVMALALVSLLLPDFNTLTGKALTIDLLTNPGFLFGVIGVAVFVGVISGSYPAFVLSSFTPVTVLKGHVRGGGHARLRKALVVSQFAISAFLIIAAGVVKNQLTFIQDKNLGFNQEQIVTIPIREASMRQQYETFKQELLKHPGVVSVTASANLPGGSDFGIPIVPEGPVPEDAPPPRILAVDHDFLKTFEMELAAGPGFTTERSGDPISAFLVNEEAAQALGWDDPLSQRIGIPVVGVETSPVVGVVKDFHFRSMHEEIGPLVFFIPTPNWFSVFSVRVRAENMDETLALMEQTWTTFEPIHPFTYSFLDQQFAQLHQAEAQISKLLTYATALAIFIACLGLFGLAAFTAEQRTKEIGIRKVLGASVGGIVLLLSKDFARLVTVAFVVAAPLAYLAMTRWLETFAYAVGLSWGVFLLAGSLALTIALLTVSYQAIRAAVSDPVKALRYE